MRAWVPHRLARRARVLEPRRKVSAAEPLQERWEPAGPDEAPQLQAQKGPVVRRDAEVALHPGRGASSAESFWARTAAVRRGRLPPAEPQERGLQPGPWGAGLQAWADRLLQGAARAGAGPTAREARRRPLGVAVEARRRRRKNPPGSPST